MSTVSPSELLEEIRDGLPANVWSQAVRTVRRGMVTQFGHEGDVWRLDVSTGAGLPHRVELDLDGGDWSCVCPSRLDACAHVAAAALHLTQCQSEKSKPAGHATEGDGRPHLRHVFEVYRAGWQLTTEVCQGDEAGKPLTALPTAKIHMEAGDREVVAFPGWALFGGRRVLRQVPAHQLNHLLRALSLCRDVRALGMAVSVNPEPVAPVLIVEDHPQGLRVRLGPGGIHHGGLSGIPELVVVGQRPTLRPMGVAPLPFETADRYRQGRLIGPRQSARFLSETLPRLRRRIPVEMRADTAPRKVHLRPYALLRLTEADGGVDAMGTVAYGDPVVAVVAGDSLYVTPGSKTLPERVHREERRLGAMIEAKVGVSPGRKRRLRGADAARFLARVAVDFEGRIEGRELVGKMRVREGQLRARWQEGGRGLSFEISGRGESGGERASAQEVLDAWREGRPLVQLLDGGYARLPEDWMEQWGPLVEAILEAKEDEGEVYRQVARAQLTEAIEEGPDGQALRRAARAWLDVPEVEPDPALRATLRSYQLQGLSWMTHLASRGLGAILADDMGLGKTLQALAFLLRDGQAEHPSLVVAPTSVLHGWVNEAARFAPSLTLRLYHGADRSLEDLAGGEIVVTSYGLLRRDGAALAARHWHRVILDEAQAIKNPASQVAKAARSIPATTRLALTGTPVENHLAELWSILDFVNPGVLGSRRAFTERFGDLEGAGRDVAVRRLRVRVQPFILRRLKQDVAKELPKKTEVVLRCPLSTDERRLYDALRISTRAEVGRMLGRGKQGGLQLLELLLRLRQACCHPGLVPGSGELGQRDSNKVRLLVKQLKVILDEEHKALVFSQWTSLLDRVEPALKRAGIDWVRLDGSTRDRQAVVERFQSEDGPGVFLISLKAGGTGLNLTAADYVYLLDPWWNPAVEAQAIDRTYRIGQTRPVVATRIVAADTIEERVLDLQEKKRALTEAALGGEAAWLQSLSGDELDALLES